MEIKKKNNLKLGMFCAVLGFVAAAVIWAFLKVMAGGTELIWEKIPEAVSIPGYTILICTLGGLVIGIFRKMAGDYPEELPVVLGKVKKEKTYDYKKMPLMLVGALLPLLIGSSIGPEAGLTGIVIGLCYWAGSNMKFAGKNTKEYSEIGAAVTLGVLFHSPLFGIFAVEEEENEAVPSITKQSKIFLYGLAIFGGAAGFKLLNYLFGAGMEGFPSFTNESLPQIKDYMLMAVYVGAGCILAMFYELTHKGAEKAGNFLPPVVRETAAGLFLGLTGTFVPAVMFSGEEQMAVLMTDYMKYLPWMLMGTAFLKILLTNVCIKLGLKGGHFFPIIFSGVCMGYGIAVFAGANIVFAAAVVTASLLGAVMKKPIAVTMLLFLCFPVKMFVWLFLSALFGSRIGKSIHEACKKSGQYI